MASLNLALIQEEQPISQPKKPNVNQDSDTDKNSQILNEKDCFSLMQQLVNQFMTNSEMVLQIYRNSGKDYNDFGRYHECIDIPGFDYLLADASFSKQIYNPMSVGLCIPNVCKEYDLNSFKPYVIPAVNSYLSLIFSQVKHIDSKNLQLKNSEVRFVYSQQQNQQITQFTFSSFIFIFLVCSLFIAVLISSILNYRYIVQRKQIAIQKRKEQQNQNSTNFEQSKSLLCKDKVEDEEKVIKIQLSDMTKLQRIMRCFSLQRNLKKLFTKRKYDQDDEEFEILNAIKVYCISCIVLGNTYFYVLSGPLQNLNIVQECLSSFSFLFVIQADLLVDIFFWISGFTISYSILKKFKQNDGVFPKHPARIVLERYLRILPLYFFMIFFLWKFISLLGGDGPRFYQYYNENGCGKSWIWHILMVNNILPWGERDYCIEPSWYLANDFWYLICCLVLVVQYSKSKNYFNIMLAILSLGCFVGSTIQLSSGNYSASFLTQYNQYWTQFYTKPWARIQPYLIGILFGCTYFSFKFENNQLLQKSRFTQLFLTLQNQNNASILSISIGLFLQIMMICFCKMISSSPKGVPKGWSVIYLLFGRPVFIIGFSLAIMPLILQNQMTKPLRAFLGHSLFAPYARLTFGVFLSHSIFMQFNIFNLQNGLWAKKMQINLDFFAYLAISFIFSFFTYIFVESPFANFLNDLLRFRKKISQEVHKESQSAKAHLRDKSKKNKVKNEKKQETSINSNSINEEKEDEQESKNEIMSSKSKYQIKAKALDDIDDDN